MFKNYAGIISWSLNTGTRNTSHMNYFNIALLLLLAVLATAARIYPFQQATALVVLAANYLQVVMADDHVYDINYD